MAATPYKGIIKLKTTKGVVQYPFTASDVAAAKWVFQDGNTKLQIPLEYGNAALIDINLSAAGVDTSQATIIVNAKDTGNRVLGVANLYTGVGRQFQNGSGLILPQGCTIEFSQLA
jgi:hypothetical protein